MRKNYFLLSISLVVWVHFSFSQAIQSKKVTNGSIHPTVVVEAIDFSISKPVREMEASKGPRTKEQQEAFKKLKKEKERLLNFDMEHRNYPYASTAKPFGPDPVWQKKEGNVSSRNSKAPILNFAGQNSPYSVSDCNGAAGPNHYMQGVNTTFAIWDKTGNQVVAPTDFNTLFQGVDGASNNDGDPIVIYDEQADRWFAAEFAGAYSNPDYMLIAVSTTNDPTGTWYRWSFTMTGFPDYMKFGVWRDGYYMGCNAPGGNDMYVFEREVMLTGGASPKMVGFANANRPNSGFHCVQPLDNDGAFAPVGTPGQFITINDDAWGGSNDEIWIYELNVDWTTTSNSTFQRTQTIATQPFDANFGSSWANIAQLGTTQKVDAVPQVLMYRAQYRNFGTSQTIVCAHSVDVDATDHAGIRWYELENTGSTWSIRQEGTYAPDEHSRWIPSISMDINHNIAVGYNISSSTMYPGIRYAGQSALENQNASGILDIAEENVFNGTSSHSTDDRWADYAEMSVDPTDDETFWFTTEHANGSNSKSTRIVSFKFAPVIVYDTDAGATSLIAPVTALDLTASETVQVMIKNFGNNNISNVPVYYQLNGGSVVSEVYSGTIAPGATASHTFAGTVDLSAPGFYEFKIFTGLSADMNLNNDTIVRTIEHTVPTYCGATGGNDYEFISNVDFVNISNASGESEYTDFTAVSTVIERGATEAITITIDGGYTSDQCLVWVDWNQDYDFDDADEFYTIGTGQGPLTGNIIVPSDANLGNVRMRVRLHDTTTWYTPNSTPCGASGYGEVEDYTLMVTSPTGINNLANIEGTITLSPNPVDDIATLTFSETSKVEKINIVDITGKIVLSLDYIPSKNKDIDFKKFENGVYFIELIQNNLKTESLKFVVQH